MGPSAADRAAAPLAFDGSSSGIDGVLVVQRSPFADERGDFGRLFCEDVFGDRVIGTGRLPVRQVNLSRNALAGTVRGLHVLLPPVVEHKVITCVAGAIWDVAVDLRPGSTTVGRWFARELRGDEDRSLVIPPGVAHGYQVLEPDSRVLYLHSTSYRKELDAGVRADDPDIAIAWPLPVVGRSERDVALPTLSEHLALVARLTDGG